ncbi:hypothetical protein JCM3765_007663, partial [Sporobolomyces pararoseus]
MDGEIPDDELWVTAPSPNPFISLFPLLPLLRHLDLTEHPDVLSWAPLQYRPSFTNLRSLAVALPASHDLSSLDFVADLPSVTKLHIVNLRVVYSAIIPPARPLEGIGALEMDGSGIRKELVEALVQATPNLSQFTLVEDYRDSDIPVLLQTLPSGLKALEVHGIFESDQIIDSVLPRFQSLERLSIWEQIYSSSIHEALLQLPALSYVELSYGKTDATQLKHLLTSTHRPPRLRFITLNHVRGVIGRRVGSPRKKDFAWNKESSQYQTTMASWKLPRWGTPDLFNRHALKQFMEAAKERGIEASGTGLEALQRVEHYFIELNNRSVLHAYYEKDFKPLVKSRERALEYDYHLPEIDIDSLGTELEIVETPLPEMNWFILSLKNKEEAIHEKEEDREAGKVEGGD